TELSAQDFLALATTAHLLGNHNDTVNALQRAHQAALAADDVLTAFRAAHLLVSTLAGRGEHAIARGWLARAERLLDAVEGDVVERGYLSERLAFDHIMKGEFADAIALAPEVTEYGQRFGDADLLAMGLHMEGRLAIYSGRVPEGLGRLDEALVGIIAGEVSPVWSGVVYCSAIEACQEISDYGRMGEWTHALTNWCDAQPGLVAFTGQCAVHRGSLMRLHGAYDDAVREFERAAERYAAAGGSPAVGLSHFERGEVLRLRGEYDAAESAYAEAAESGHPAQPGRALMWLARGRSDTAVAAIRRVLAEVQDPVHRSQMLPAAVDVLVEVGEVDDAAPLAEELSRFGEDFGCTGLQAAGDHAVGTIALARGEGETSLASARRAVDGWSRLSAPYDAARSRVLIGRALRLLGDEQSAAADLAAARKVFAELGAVPAERSVTGLLGATSAPAGLSPREMEVLQLVAAGRSNSEIAAELVLSQKTVARHLSNIFAKLDVGSRTAAAAFAYEHDLA
ncbi:MAG: LuxR C-terminal-related transcriptional regulator, partial [Aeromicrobium sp.]